MNAQLILLHLSSPTPQRAREGPITIPACNTPCVFRDWKESGQPCGLILPKASANVAQHDPGTVSIGDVPHFTGWNYFTECTPTSTGDAPQFWPWLKPPCHPLLTHHLQSGQNTSETLLIKSFKTSVSASKLEQGDIPRFLPVRPMGWAGVEPPGNLRPGAEGGPRLAGAARTRRAGIATRSGGGGEMGVVMGRSWVVIGCSWGRGL